jgi:hypothetical protein
LSCSKHVGDGGDGGGGEGGGEYEGEGGVEGAVGTLPVKAISIIVSGIVFEKSPVLREFAVPR